MYTALPWTKDEEFRSVLTVGIGLIQKVGVGWRISLTNMWSGVYLTLMWLSLLVLWYVTMFREAGTPLLSVV